VASDIDNLSNVTPKPLDASDGDVEYKSMESTLEMTRTTNKKLWTGRVLSGLVVLFLLFDSVMKILKLAPAVQGTIQLGYPENVVISLGIVLLVCTVLYAIPRTAILGAVLLTGYLGGAVATQVRVGNPLFGYVLFPVYLGVLIWVGLLLREGRLRVLIPLRS
jgi:hypothetical protein